MASTNKTDNLQLSKFVATDIPAWLADYNGDMDKIDAGFAQNSDAIEVLRGEVALNKDAVDAIAPKVTANEEAIVALDPQGDVKNAGGISEYVRDLIQEIDISMDKMYPVGSVYISMVNQSPFDLFGFGSWERIAAGKVLVGVDERDSTFQQPGQTGGSKDLQKHTHTGPSHTHAGPSHSHAKGTLATASAGVHNHRPAHLILEGAGAIGWVGTTGQWSTLITSADGAHTHSITGATAAAGNNATGASGTGVTSSTGLGEAQNLQPYLTCYFWSRTA